MCVRFSPGLFKQKIEAVEDRNKDNSEDKPKLHTVGCMWKSRYKTYDLENKSIETGVCD